MSALAGVGSVSYNGIDFPSHLRSSCTIIPVHDRAKRTIKARTYHLRVESVFVSDDLALGVDVAVDAGMANVRKKLEQQGGELTFNAQGLGNITANYQNVLDYGPIPKVLIWEPIGSNKAVRLVWECEFTLSECENDQTSNIGEFNYTVNHAYNDAGMLHRTITGVVEVRVRRTSEKGRRIDNTAEAAWALLSFPRLPGFHRTHSRDLSDDRRFLHFQVIDVEIPSDNPYFPGMVKMDVTQRVTGGFSSGNRLWTISFDGRIEVAPGVNRTEGWRAFVSVVSDRVSGILRSTDPYNGRITGPELTLEEEIFGRVLRFHFSFRVSSTLQSILQNSGLWKPVSGSWAAWSSSMDALDAPGKFGNSGVRYQTQNDVIVDFCTSYTPTQTPQSPPQIRIVPPTYAMPVFLQPCPPPAVSWLKYENYIHLSYNGRTVTYSRVGGKPSSGLEIEGISPIGGDAVLDDLGAQDDVAFQNRSSGELEIIVRGRALRVGHRIQLPKLKSVGGKKPIHINDEVTANAVVGYNGKCPVYASQWVRRYRIPSMKKNLKLDVDEIPAQFDGKEIA